MKLSVECDAKKVEYDTAHAQTDHLYNEWQQERSRYFCVYCFKPMFLDVLVEERLNAESILSDINQMEDNMSRASLLQETVSWMDTVDSPCRLFIYCSVQ